MVLSRRSVTIVDNWRLLAFEKEAELGAALPIGLLPTRRQGLHRDASARAPGEAVMDRLLLAQLGSRLDDSSRPQLLHLVDLFHLATAEPPELVLPLGQHGEDLFVAADVGVHSVERAVCHPVHEA